MNPGGKKKKKRPPGKGGRLRGKKKETLCDLKKEGGLFTRTWRKFLMHCRRKKGLCISQKKGNTSKLEGNAEFQLKQEKGEAPTVSRNEISVSTSARKKKRTLLLRLRLWGEGK